MKKVRRSLRLNSRTTINSPTPPTATRFSQVWRGKSKNDSSSESDDYSEANPSFNQALTKKKVFETEIEDEENNENYNAMNKIIQSGRRSTRRSKIDEATKTPRSNKILVRFKNGNDGCDNDNDKAAGTETLEVSPSKQARIDAAIATKLVTSPSRLIERLSIDERSEVSESFDDNDGSVNNLVSDQDLLQSTHRNKYQDARKALNNAETQILPGRERELQELRDFFTEHLTKRRSGSLYVSGQPGTGKTACLSLLLRSPEFANRLQSVYINCTSISSVGCVYKKLSTELKLTVTGRTERDHLAAVQHHLIKSSRMVLIVLDEIDQLCTSRQSVLYTIFEWPALFSTKLLLVGVANTLDLTDRTLMRLNARCELKPRLMHFPPYTKQQIIDIFKARLQEADVLDVFPPVTLQLLAAKVSAVSGDVRRALDIGRRLVEEITEQTKRNGRPETSLLDLDLDQEGEFKPVGVTQVADVLNKVYGASQNLQEDIEDSFPLQQKIMLCTLMLMLRKERNKDINIGRLHDLYRRICIKRNFHALDQAEFAGLVDLIETRGILRLIRKKETRSSKVILLWDEDEVNDALRDKQLIASILNDTDCLSK